MKPPLDPLPEQNIRVRRFEVDQNFDGWRLDRFLASKLSRISRTRAASIASCGDVEIQPHRRPKASLRLRRGDVIILREHLPPERVQDDEIFDLFEDDDLLVLNKPAGMLVHEAASVRLNTIQAFLLRRGLPQAEPVHRIDKETSGVLVCAKDKTMVKRMRALFATDHPHKEYRTLVIDPSELWTPGAKTTLDTPLGLCPTSSLGIRMSRGTLSATTHVQVVRRVEHPFSPMAELRVRIETGRQHQIRVHLSLFGTPVAGDKLYRYDDAFFVSIMNDPEDPEWRSKLAFPRHALHATRIEFRHPRTGDPVVVEAPLPTIWEEVSTTATPLGPRSS